MWDQFVVLLVLFFLPIPHIIFPGCSAWSKYMCFSAGHFLNFAFELLLRVWAVSQDLKDCILFCFCSFAGILSLYTLFEPSFCNYNHTLVLGISYVSICICFHLYLLPYLTLTIFSFLLQNWSGAKLFLLCCIFLDGEIYCGHMGFGSWLFDVDCLDGKKSALFWGYWEITSSITSSMPEDSLWLV